jgi:glutamine amidotransferase
VIAVLDYGAGNLRSVVRALEYAGAQPRITADKADLDAAEAIVLPGVGAAQAIMGGLRERGLVEPLLANIRKGKPFLGLCLGLQALLTYSDEGGRQDCLDVIPGAVHRLPDGFKVPQMGWNQVEARVEHPLLNGIPNGASFYFVHSFYVQPDDEATIVATTEYGVRFPSILAQGNVFATQFHPEKSGSHGLLIYRNFVRQARACS